MKAIIFDVDGTIAETEELHRRSFNQTFADMGVDRLWPDPRAGWYWDEDLYRRLLQTTGGKERISAYLRDDLGWDTIDLQPVIAELHAAKSSCFARLLADGGIAPRSGVERVLAMAGSAGVSLAIATTTSGSNVDALCRTLFSKAPHELYHLTLARLDLPASACVALEDSRNGLMAAKRAGLRCVISPSLYTREECFDEADWLVDEYAWEMLDEILRS